MKRKSVREVVENPQPNEYYVLVTRYYPRQFRMKGLTLEKLKQMGMVHVWDRDLAPSAELLKRYKANPDWEQYTLDFCKEKSQKIIKERIIIYWERASEQRKEVVLVCQEEKEEFPKCHTWILLAFFVIPLSEGGWSDLGDTNDEIVHFAELPKQQNEWIDDNVSGK